MTSIASRLLKIMLPLAAVALTMSGRGMPSKRRREARLKDFFRTRNAPMRNVLQTVTKVLDHAIMLDVAPPGESR